MTDLTADTFMPHEGTTFTLLAENGTAPLVLAAVERGESPGGEQRAPFSLWFTSPPDVAVPQGTFALEHDELGRLDIFLVPRAPEPGGPPRYEAVFN